MGEGQVTAYVWYCLVITTNENKISMSWIEECILKNILLTSLADFLPKKYLYDE
jgi:hypothetical protein